jgi:hypothetical protein
MLFEIVMKGGARHLEGEDGLFCFLNGWYDVEMGSGRACQALFL